MEKGTIIILKGKKGYVAKVLFTKTDGKSAELPLPSYTPKDDKYNNTPCTFKRDRGTLVQLIAHDGTELYSAAVSTSQSSSERYSGQDAKGQQGQAGNQGADSYAPGKTFLPGDTKKVLDTISSPDNFALKLNKAARYDEVMKKFQFYKRDRKGENYSIRPAYGAFDFKQLADRSLKDAKRLLPANNVLHTDLQTDWRLAQGLGIESVYEISLTLHHTYGIPYIPASALKGVVRSWIIVNYFDSKEEKAIQQEAFCNLFGCPSELKVNNGEFKSFFKEARQGNILFFDAYPLTPPVIEFDIMNPHYGQYYAAGSSKPPADYFQPVPVHFITVAKTGFRFIIGAKESAWLTDCKIDGKPIFEWMKEALMAHGIGAKTAVGYGFMNSK